MKFTKAICSGEEIDLENDVWTVIGASDRSINKGDSVSHNSIVGFKHKVTGYNLHSHDILQGKVTPISKQQQGICCVE
jgi:hypothetical protein